MAMDQRASHVGASVRAIENLLPQRGPIHAFPNAGRSAEDLLHYEQRGRRRADSSNGFDVLRLRKDPTGGRRQLRHLDDRTAAKGMHNRTRPARDHISEQSGRHSITYLI